MPTKVLILAVLHKDYLNLNPNHIIAWVGKPLANIDRFGFFPTIISAPIL
jgi:hypothetical protein